MPPSPSSSRQLSIIVLTQDEDANLPHLLRSARCLNADIWIVNSGSTDGTAEYAAANGCQVIHHRWTTHADQINWAIETLPLATPWVMRMDADERFTPELVTELNQRLATFRHSISGLLVKRRVHFWGQWIRHGGYYPTWLLRIWRRGRARCEDRQMDEHMVIRGGETIRLNHDIIDENRKGLSFWIEKHNRYADREANELLTPWSSYDRPRIAGQAGRRRWMKEKVYASSPLFFRAFAYWFYRYILRLGFLDGRAGLVFHSLQGGWYRFLIDAKVYECHFYRRGLLAKADPPIGRRGEEDSPR